jgi:flagellin
MASINTNLPALTAQRNMGLTQSLFHKTVTRLSSGLRINNAADDAAGAFLGQKLKNQVRGLQQASRNAQDGVGLLQTAEGGLSVHNDILLRLRELAVQSANGIMTDSDRALTIAPEVDALVAELTRVSQTTKFNGVNVLDGTMGGSQVTKGIDVNVRNPSNTAMVTFAHDWTTHTPAAGAGGNSLTAARGIDGIVAFSSDPTRPHFYAVQVTSDAAATDSVDITLQKLAADTADAGFTNDVRTTGTLATQTITVSNVSGIKGSQLVDFDQLGIAVYVNSAVGTDGAGVAEGLDRTVATAAGTSAEQNLFVVSADLASVDTDSATAAIDTTSVLAPGLQGVLLQVGANNVASDQLTLLAMNDMSAAGLGLTASTATMSAITGSTMSLSANLSTQQGALQGIDIIDKAIEQVSGARSRIGAYQNRLDYSITNLGVAAENQQAAVSRIFDADVASEVSELVRTQILSQSAMAILAQANAAPQALLSLFR